MYGWRARIGHAALLEAEIGNPVITSSLACIWCALTRARVTEPISGFGRLMASLGT